MNTINEIVNAISSSISTKSLILKEENNLLIIKHNNVVTTIFNWKSTPVSDIVNAVRNQTLNESSSQQLILG